MKKDYIGSQAELGLAQYVGLSEKQFSAHVNWLDEAIERVCYGT